MSTTMTDVAFVPTCFLCDKEVRNPVACPRCDAVHYCSINHLKLDRAQSHQPDDCRRAATHMQTAPGIHFMPFFPWHPQTNGHPSLCTQLMESGVHGKGPWQRECPCSGGMAYGTQAPLLKQLWRSSSSATVTRAELAERLADWWGVPGGSELLTTARQTADPAPCDWESYCAQRPLETSSLLPVLLDTPLTILWAVNRWRAKTQAPGEIGSSSPPTRLVIYCVGAEKEVDQWPTLLELGALLPFTEVVLHVMGPEVPCWADNRSLTVANPSPPGANAASAPTMQISFHQGLIQDVVGRRLNSASHHPDVVVGLNAGLGAYQPWMFGLAVLRRMMQVGGKPKVLLFTDYMAESIYIARRNSNMLFGPLRGTEFRDECCGYHGEIDISGRVSMSGAEVNPFRKPRWVKQPNHSMPFCHNGFAFWLELD